MKQRLKAVLIASFGAVLLYNSVAPAQSRNNHDENEECSVTSIDAGYGRIGASGGTIALNATVESDPDGCVNIAWKQITGDALIEIDDASAEDPTLTLPTVEESVTAVMQMTVFGGRRPQTDTVIVETWVAADSSADNTVVEDYTAQIGWQCDQDPVADPSLTIADLGADTSYTSNAVPAHATGTFRNRGNPHTITPQIVTYFIPNDPVKTTTATEMRQFGITVDGIFIERETAEWFGTPRTNPPTSGDWLYEAVTPSGLGWLGTDCANAHVQPDGQYHYHAMMEPLINKLGEGLKRKRKKGEKKLPAKMILGGYAADGFPFYLRYGYEDPHKPNKGIKVMEASWEIKSGARPSIGSEFPEPGGDHDGSFRQDWEYVEGSGDLDQCNGRFGKTPEHPDGIYHYYITDDYPYVPRCVFGTPDDSFWLCDGSNGPPC